MACPCDCADAYSDSKASRLGGGDLSLAHGQAIRPFCRVKASGETREALIAKWNETAQALAYQTKHILDVLTEAGEIR